jgi:hypothetical protein
MCAVLKSTVALGQRLWPIGHTTAHLDAFDIDGVHGPDGCTTAQQEGATLLPAIYAALACADHEVARPWASHALREFRETVFLDFKGQRSGPQVNLKYDDEPEPKPPASNIFSILIKPDFPTLVSVVVPGKMCQLRFVTVLALIEVPSEQNV